MRYPIGSTDDMIGHGNIVPGTADVCFGSIASIQRPGRHFRSRPISGHRETGPVGQFCVNSGRGLAAGG
jgi:hypothetical protein